jgi:predicted RNA-binding Zn ribbon-like protein
MAAAAPDPLALAAGLLNRTADGTPLTIALLRTEAAAAGYDPGAAAPSDVDLVTSVLPAQRRVFGAADDADAVDVLNGLLRLAPVRPRLVLAGDGSPTLAMHGQDEAFGVVFLSDFSLAAAALAAQGQVGRLQQCSASGCTQVFVDRSRSRGRRYCDMRTCGNRTNVAAYRERQRTAPSKRGRAASARSRRTDT